MNEGQSGIYAITNIINNKIYLGSTNDFVRRWKEHKAALQQSKHPNPHLQSSWNKYGEDAFEFDILEYSDNLGGLAKDEQFWMDKYREEGKELYNIALATDNPMRGRNHTEAAKCKIGEAQKGKKVSKKTRRKMRRSLADRWYTETLDFIKVNREWLGTNILYKYNIFCT